MQRVRALVPEATPTSATPTDSTPKITTSSSPTNKPVLNNDETKVMQCLGEVGIELVADIGDATGFHPVTVDRIRHRLETVFGFATSEGVRTGTGKGTNGLSVSLTPVGTTGSAPSHT